MGDENVLSSGSRCYFERTWYCFKDEKCFYLAESDTWTKLTYFHALSRNSSAIFTFKNATFSMPSFDKT